MASRGSHGTLIIGASHAGLELAVSLRRLGDTAPITLIGAERQPPYQRPPLSKEFLSGRLDPEGLALRAPEFYREAGIDVMSGELVTRLERDPSGPPGSGVATTAGGRRLPYTRLALTPGARPRRLALPGADLGGICYLRTHDDAVRLRAELAGARRVVVVGGGFVGLEAAAAARAADCAVTVVEAAPRLLARAVAPVVSDFYVAAHRRRGTEVLLATGVAGFTGTDGRVDHVLLAGGGRLPADLVLVGVGAEPRTELAEQLGLECDGGIVVDERGRTSDPTVVAAGDCTVQSHPELGRVRLESVPNAQAQAQAAAATLLGLPAPAAPVPWFWSHQGDLMLQIAGLSAGHDQLVVRGEPDTERFSVLYYRSGRLVAVDAVNHAADYIAVRAALGRGLTIAPVPAAADPDTPLKQLMTPVDLPVPTA